MKLSAKEPLCVLVISLFSNIALAQTFQTYTVVSYPQGNESCEETARSLGQKFADKTDKPVFRTACDRQSYYGFDVTITYVSPQPAQLVSTYRESGGLGYQGIYSNLAECESSHDFEVERFEAATSLPVFLSYCYRVSSITDTPFAVRIDAFGSPQLYPYRYEHSLFGAILGRSAQNVLDEISDSSSSLGIIAPYAAIANDASEKLVLRFFDLPENSVHRHRYFDVEEMGKYYSYNTSGTQQSCLSQLGSAQSIFSFENPAVWFCVWDDLTFQARLYVFRVKPRETIKFEEPPLTYETFAACDVERDDLVTYYRNQLGKDALGALCYWDDGFWGGVRDTYKAKVYLSE